ncbi:hypothetical protein WN982_00295 [Paraburkholderia sp. IMGN_8]|uniref:hypothetical protein n=1 Tax=Paraburkholderia sp. IMGN_8 TaxID=3136564 RepID=UPI0031017DA6
MSHIPARPEQTQLPAIQPGDRVRSIHAGRVGTAVKIYADGSAAIHWDDVDPQPEGLAHERMPRHLLTLLSPDSSNEFANAKAVVASTLERAYARASDSTSGSSTGGATGFIDVEFDGAGGAIMRIVRDLSRFELAFVLAACGPRSFGRQPETRSRWPWRNDDIWHTAINFVIQFVPGVERKEYRDTNLTRWLTERHFGADHKCGAIGEMVGVHRDTAARHGRAISKLLGAQEHSIWSHLAARLRDIGVIDGTPSGSLA